MARPREFDEDVALDGARDVFWEHGYDNATLPDILDGMGLTRGSLYKAYKDKRSLFLTVLARYDTQMVDKGVHTLTDDSIDGWDRITTLFNGAAQSVAKGDRRGCLLCTTAAGPAAYDAEIAKSTDESLNKMRSGFEAALHGSIAHKGQSADEITAQAQLLTTLYVGLRILARSQAPDATVQATAQAIQRLKPAPAIPH